MRTDDDSVLAGICAFSVRHTPVYSGTSGNITYSAVPICNGRSCKHARSKSLTERFYVIKFSAVGDDARVQENNPVIDGYTYLNRMKERSISLKSAGKNTIAGACDGA